MLAISAVLRSAPIIFFRTIGRLEAIFDAHHANKKDGARGRPRAVPVWGLSWLRRSPCMGEVTAATIRMQGLRKP